HSRSLVAIDRDTTRAETLRELVSKSTSNPDLVEVRVQDFLALDPESKSDPAAQAEYILLDPSCSGSGIARREHHLLDEKPGATRLWDLSAFQFKALLHALSFPRVKRVVYSTCSIHVQENEAVVRDVLQKVGAQSEDQWKIELVPAWPEECAHGRGQEGLEECIRACPNKICAMVLEKTRCGQRTGKTSGEVDEEALLTEAGERGSKKKKKGVVEESKSPEDQGNARRKKKKKEVKPSDEPSEEAPDQKKEKKEKREKETAHPFQALLESGDITIPEVFFEPTGQGFEGGGTVSQFSHRVTGALDISDPAIQTLSQDDTWGIPSEDEEPSEQFLLLSSENALHFCSHLCVKSAVPVADPSGYSLYSVAEGLQNTHETSVDISALEEPFEKDDQWNDGKGMQQIPQERNISSCERQQIPQKRNNSFFVDADGVNAAESKPVDLQER
ncbi:unnamed protein product, partial [Cyprideis torosa]